MRILLAILFFCAGLEAAPIPLVFQKNPTASAGATYLLDVPGVATPYAAFGLIKLRSAYSGPSIRLRRSSDSTETDVSFDTATSPPSVTLNSTVSAGGSLSAWVGSNDGLVTKFYDEVHSHDSAQGTAAWQPKLIAAGVLNTRNSIASMEASGDAQCRLVYTSTSIAQPYSVFIIGGTASSGAGSTPRFFSANSFAVTIGVQSSTTFGFYAGSVPTYTESYPVTACWFGLWNGASSYLYKNDVAKISAQNVGSATLNNNNALMNSDNGGQPLGGGIQVVIVFDSDAVTASHTAMYNNIKSIFSLP